MVINNMNDLGYNRNRDVQNIFNDRYRANNNYGQINDQINKQRDFQRQMYGGVSSLESSTSKNERYIPTNEDRLKEMNQNIESNKQVHNQDRVNNLLNRFGRQ